MTSENYLIVKFITLMLAGLLTSLNLAQAQSPSKPAKGGFKSLFDGKTLKGWEGDPQYWRVANGSIVGEITPEKPLQTNTFLIWRGSRPKDFELVTEFRISESGNSGINYRSEEVAGIPFALRGYQADIDGKNTYTGQNYEERGRTTLAYRGQKTMIRSPDNASASLPDNIKNNAWTPVNMAGSLGNTDELKKQIKSEDWNECRLVVKGNRLQHYINGVLMSDVTDNDTTNRKMAGLLGMQVHVGPPMKVEYRKIRLKEL